MDGPHKRVTLWSSTLVNIASAVTVLRQILQPPNAAITQMKHQPLHRNMSTVHKNTGEEVELQILLRKMVARELR